MKLNIAMATVLLTFAGAVAAESPCIECMKAAQNRLALCYANAKTDKEKSSCDKTLQGAVASCNAGVCKK